MNRAPLKVVIADDQRVVRDGLVTILNAMDGVTVAGAAQDGGEAVALAEQHDADVVLMDLRMPGTDGVEATKLLRGRRPDIAVVVLTTYTDDESILAALAAGASGYLTKNATTGDIRRALEAAASGQSVLDRMVGTRLVQAANRQAAAPRPAPGGLPGGLTEREGEVLALIAEGLSNTEIAGRIHVSKSTVKTHINQIYAKTGSRDRVQAILYAQRNGIAEG
ncbi:MAG TPA: response regulator transcription factor [Actinocrinis sp.]|jgi:DNA-binding NarL/FixJ family response regulator